LPTPIRIYFGNVINVIMNGGLLLQVLKDLLKKKELGVQITDSTALLSGEL
jgi:hypothetical protein